jgi:hypothetical protein
LATLSRLNLPGGNVTGVSLFLKLSLLSNLIMHDLRARFRSRTAERTNFPA